MSSPFVAEIKMWGGNFAPVGYALCNGQLLPISQNTALFSLIGTYYGGNGTTTFALPNLQDSTPLGQGQGPGLSQYYLGQQGGEPIVTLLTAEIPLHNHNFGGTNTAGDQPVAAPDRQLAKASPGNAYQSATSNNLTQLNPSMLSINGGNLPHNNMMPFIVLTFIIALQGVFPPRS
jgi:microcystin-dependent protein